MKVLALVVCLWASSVFAQEIYIQGPFPPRDMGDIEIIYPDGWKQERVEKIFSSALDQPMQGVHLRYKDAQGKEHAVWIVLSLEETD